MQLADISHKFEEKIADTKELEHLLDLNMMLNIYEHDRIVYIQLAHSNGTGTVVSRSPLEFDREYNHIAQSVYDKELKCVTINDDSYDTDDRVSVKELIQLLKAELNDRVRNYTGKV